MDPLLLQEQRVYFVSYNLVRDIVQSPRYELRHSKSMTFAVYQSMLKPPPFEINNHGRTTI